MLCVGTCSPITDTVRFKDKSRYFGEGGCVFRVEKMLGTNCTFDLYFFVYERNNSFLRCVYSGHTVIKCISSPTLLAQRRQNALQLGLVLE